MIFIFNENIKEDIKIIDGDGDPTNCVVVNCNTELQLRDCSDKWLV